MFLQIIDFLIVFPPQGQALELVKSNDNSEVHMFPLNTPFKALYSLHTLSICLHGVALAVDVSLYAICSMSSC
jgi:ubiquitin carboxyl-terminal hydrolase 34